MFSNDDIKWTNTNVLPPLNSGWNISNGSKVSNGIQLQPGGSCSCQLEGDTALTVSKYRKITFKVQAASVDASYNYNSFLQFVHEVGYTDYYEEPQPVYHTNTACLEGNTYDAGVLSGEIAVEMLNLSIDSYTFSFENNSSEVVTLLLCELCVSDDLTGQLGEVGGGPAGTIAVIQVESISGLYDISTPQGSLALNILLPSRLTWGQIEMQVSSPDGAQWIVTSNSQYNYVIQARRNGTLIVRAINKDNALEYGQAIITIQNNSPTGWALVDESGQPNYIVTPSHRTFLLQPIPSGIWLPQFTNFSGWAQAVYGAGDGILSLSFNGGSIIDQCTIIATPIYDGIKDIQIVPKEGTFGFEGWLPIDVTFQVQSVAANFSVVINNDSALGNTYEVTKFGETVTLTGILGPDDSYGSNSWNYVSVDGGTCQLSANNGSSITVVPLKAGQVVITCERTYQSSMGSISMMGSVTLNITYSGEGDMNVQIVPVSGGAVISEPEGQLICNIVSPVPVGVRGSWTAQVQSLDGGTATVAVNNSTNTLTITAGKQGSVLVVVTSSNGGLQGSLQVTITGQYPEGVTYSLDPDTTEIAVDASVQITTQASNTPNPDYFRFTWSYMSLDGKGRVGLDTILSGRHCQVWGRSAGSVLVSCFNYVTGDLVFSITFNVVAAS